ncbi:MAG: hypothetical protein H6937_11870 [Burkholderiales bacterium]|nr:hypothetical protein [Burkholderiales bacterium]MDR4517381.1 hypothetical protein [Nitrosomonas sp.]
MSKGVTPALIYSFTQHKDHLFKKADKALLAAKNADKKKVLLARQNQIVD